MARDKILKQKNKRRFFKANVASKVYINTEED